MIARCLRCGLVVPAAGWYTVAQRQPDGSTVQGRTHAGCPARESAGRVVPFRIQRPKK